MAQSTDKRMFHCGIASCHTRCTRPSDHEHEQKPIGL